MKIPALVSLSENGNWIAMAITRDPEYGHGGHTQVRWFDSDMRFLRNSDVGQFMEVAQAKPPKPVTIDWPQVGSWEPVAYKTEGEGDDQIMRIWLHRIIGPLNEPTSHQFATLWRYSNRDTDTADTLKAGDHISYRILTDLSDEERIPGNELDMWTEKYREGYSNSTSCECLGKYFGRVGLDEWLNGLKTSKAKAIQTQEYHLEIEDTEEWAQFTPFVHPEFQGSAYEWDVLCRNEGLKHPSQEFPWYSDMGCTPQGWVRICEAAGLTKPTALR